MYTREELALLNYKELRKLCKQTGVKANRKHYELVDDLFQHFLNAENEMKELEKEMQQYESTDLNTTFTYEEEEEKGEGPNEKKVNEVEKNKEEKNEEENEKENKDIGEVNENKDGQLLKATLMKEVERRAEEKLSKIPRFVVDKVIIPDVKPSQPVTPDISKKRSSRGIKMDSIDQYLEKKKKRASEHLKLKDNYKENSVPTKRGNIPIVSRKSVKISNDTTIDFSPKVNSTPSVKETRISPRIAALKDANRPKPILSSLKDSKSNTNLNSSERSSKKNKRVTLSGISSRKSDIRKSTARKSEVRKSLNSSSPFVPKALTPKAKTPVKFDLQQSLKKVLPYKPHTGKLKEVYFTQESATSGVPRKNVEKRTADRKVSVKELTKNLSTREKRRNEATAKREKSRLVILDKRRGIVG